MAECRIALHLIREYSIDYNSVIDQNHSTWQLATMDVVPSREELAHIGNKRI